MFLTGWEFGLIPYTFFPSIFFPHFLSNFPQEHSVNNQVIKKMVPAYSQTNCPLGINWAACKPHPFFSSLTIFNPTETPLWVTRFSQFNPQPQPGPHSLITSDPSTKPPHRHSHPQLSHPHPLSSPVYGRIRPGGGRVLFWLLEPHGWRRRREDWEGRIWEGV